MEDLQQPPADATTLRRCGDETWQFLSDCCSQGTSITYCSTREKDEGETTPNHITITAGDGSSLVEGDGIAWSNDGLVSVDQINTRQAFIEEADNFQSGEREENCTMFTSGSGDVSYR
ncbi:hypothetical protein Mapa_003245 [Marchantia paleacea]|nr:hypothetical protein Mapa_003245 [Marchantia paleacea]